MIAFVATEQRTTNYRAILDLLCKSKPRFNMYRELTTDDCLPYFHPPLEYIGETGVDKDVSKVLVDESIQSCIIPNLPDESFDASLYRRRSVSTRIPQPKPFMEGHLIVSNLRGHSALNLCNSESSHGPDFVASLERFYCDMHNKQT